MITRLTLEHLDLFLELKKNNPGQWRLGSNFDNIVDNVNFFKERLCNEKAYTIGWVEDNKLLSITTLYEFNANSSWSWLYYCNLKSNYYNSSNNHGLILANEMFLEASRRKLSMCFMLVRDDWPFIASDAIGSMKKQLEKWFDQIPEIRKYHWVDEARIPANTESNYEYIRWMCGYKSWPLDLRLRLGVLKQEYRKEILFTNRHISPK